VPVTGTCRNPMSGPNVMRPRQAVTPRSLNSPAAASLRHGPVYVPAAKAEVRMNCRGRHCNRCKRLPDRPEPQGLRRCNPVSGQSQTARVVRSQLTHPCGRVNRRTRQILVDISAGPIRWILSTSGL
jgi:hypothetical protein